jgi:type IX secretion system PorP/SprF family membrane protein
MIKYMIDYLSIYLRIISLRSARRIWHIPAVGAVSLIIIMFLCLHSFCYSQDYHFSQFYATPLHLSPSFAGSTFGTRLVANYRDQWPEIPNAFTTYSFSVDHNFSDFNSGIGLMLLRDERGELNISSNLLGFVYSYDVAIKRRIHFRPGLCFSYSFSGMDVSRAVTRDMLQLNTSTPLRTIARENFGFFDASVSALFYEDRFWLGSTVEHLMRPNAAFGVKDRIPLNYRIYTGVKLGTQGRLLKPPEENLTIAFHFMKMAKFSQLEAGMMGFKKKINLGVWYRGLPFIKENPGSDALIVSVGVVLKSFNAGFSHDFTISGLRNHSNGANEIFISYLIPQGHPPKKFVQIPCPVF